MKIAAGIVTFNPDIGVLKENIDSIINQVDVLLICDNASDNINNLEATISRCNIEIIKLKENRGIASALNIINEWCVDNDYKWLVTLDQDSKARPGLIEQYKRYVNVEDVAMMSCDLVSESSFESSSKNIKECDGYEYIEKCYTSGCFANTDIIKKTGGYDEHLFIDFVDFDMCITLLEHGYKIIRINYLGLIHEVGETKEISFLGKKEFAYNHLPIRKYYMARNGIIYAKKHKKYFGKKETLKRKLSVFKRIIIVLLYEKDKLNNLKYGLKGLFSGIFTKY